MATRALIGMIETDAAGNQVLTSTYNHYDGYPDSLGVALNRHYDEPQSAKRISNQGYISFLDPDSGAIDAKNKDKAGKDSLPDDFEKAMGEIHSIADSMGADYVYLYDFDAADWLDSRNATRAMINKFRGSGVDDQFNSYEDDPDSPLGIPGDNALGLEENRSEFDTNKPARIGKFIKALDDLVDEYHAELYLNDEIFAAISAAKSAAEEEAGFGEYTGDSGIDRGNLARGLEEENMDNKVVGDISSVVRDAERALEGKPNLDIYIDSLTNDIRLNGDDAYLDYGDDDWMEDFSEYIADRSDMNESLKNIFQHRAGIIK